MNVRRSMTVGAVVALFAGGCATHPTTNPSGRSDPSARPAASTEQPTWEARGGSVNSDGRPTPQQLAERATSYAKTMESGSPAPTGAGGPAPGAPPPPSPSPSSVHFDTPTAQAAAAQGGPAAVSPSAAVATTPSATVPPSAGAAVQASAVQHSVWSDMPMAVPDSAEFAVPSRNVDPLGARLAKKAKANPQDPVAQLDYQIYQMLNGGAEASEPQLMGIVGLPSEERDVIPAIVDGLSNFRSAVSADPNLTPTEQIRPLQDMVDRLRSGTDLALADVTLCKKVINFGLYEPLTPARFPLGRSSQLFVYCEVDNFLPRHNPDNQWETRLAQRVSLLTATGESVWEDKARSVKDTCRTRRRDFFTREPITLPPTLAAGAYKLRVTVTDLNANKVAESDVPLWVAGS